MDTVNWVSTLANGSPKCTPSEKMSFTLISICPSANQTLQKSSVVKRQRGANRFPKGFTKSSNSALFWSLTLMIFLEDQ